jgi:hypothetical protein
MRTQRMDLLVEKWFHLHDELLTDPTIILKEDSKAVHDLFQWDGLKTFQQMLFKGRHEIVEVDVFGPIES